MSNNVLSLGAEKGKSPRSALAILREKERRRRLVPAVVIRRRMAMQKGREDPGVAVLDAASRYAKRHAKGMSDLIIRSMGLVQTPEAVKRRFSRDGLDDIKFDTQAEALVANAVRKVNEILIFKMVVAELVNDPVLGERLVDLFIDQRFAVMSPKKTEPDTSAQKQQGPEPDRRLSEQHEALMGLLHHIMDT